MRLSWYNITTDSDIISMKLHKWQNETRWNNDMKCYEMTQPADFRSGLELCFASWIPLGRHFDLCRSLYHASKSCVGEMNEKFVKMTFNIMATHA